VAQAPVVTANATDHSLGLSKFGSVEKNVAHGVVSWELQAGGSPSAIRNTASLIVRRESVQSILAQDPVVAANATDHTLNSSKLDSPAADVERAYRCKIVLLVGAGIMGCLLIGITSCLVVSYRRDRSEAVQLNPSNERPDRM